MGIFDGTLSRWFGKSAGKAAARPRVAAPKPVPAPAAAPAFSHSFSSSMQPDSPHAMRKDLLRMVLRETLVRSGIPMSWIGADLLRATGRGKEAGIHVRFLLRHWDPRLLTHAVAFEQNFQKRVLIMDPLAGGWLMGMSWQFALEDTSQCPALPHPGSWTAYPPAPPAAASGAAQPAGDVISGPVSLSSNQDDARAALERMLAARDEELGNPGVNKDWEKTQPITLFANDRK